MLTRILRQLYEESPQQSLARLQDRLFGSPPKPQNHPLDPLFASSQFAAIATRALASLDGSPLVLAGTDARYAEVVEKLRSAGRTIEWRPWTWGDRAEVLAAGESATVVLCLLPQTAPEWTAVAALKGQLGVRLRLITELLLPYSQITHLHGKLDYAIPELDRLFQRYLGGRISRPIELLDACWPIAGRSVIEFGPLDGGQTADLFQRGAASVTCIEARPENVAKTRAAGDALGWRNLRLVMDDFHNADATRYGRYDLVFAHGVYYHSVAPFVFLENLRTLGDTIFLGGFCATETNPPAPWVELAYEGRAYRAKIYREADWFDAGVNTDAYHFDGEDLMRFFTERGHTVRIISDEDPKVTTGRYLRFLVTKP
jgi:hypothetical protein